MNEQTLREAFEEWCKTSGKFTDWTKLGHEMIEYQKPRVQLAWEAWQAAARWADK